MTLTSIKLRSIKSSVKKIHFDHFPQSWRMGARHKSFGEYLPYPGSCAEEGIFKQEQEIFRCASLDDFKNQATPTLSIVPTRQLATSASLSKQISRDHHTLYQLAAWSLYVATICYSSWILLRVNSHEKHCNSVVKTGCGQDMLKLLANLTKS